MKLRIVLLSATVLLLAPLVHATVTFDMALDQITNSTGTPVPDGMAIFLVADTQSNGFTLPTPGSYTAGSAWAGSGDDKILWSFAANGVTQTTSAGTMENFSPSIDYASFSNLGAGDSLAVFWFPTTAYAATTVVGQFDTYGYFTIGGTGSDNTSWIAPTDPSSGYHLNFFTAGGSIFGPGNDFASFATVPEPSTFALLGGIAALGLVARRRKTATVA